MRTLSDTINLTGSLNTLNAELNPIRHLLALVGARHVVHPIRHLLALVGARRVVHPIRHLLALVGARHVVHVSRIMVKKFHLPY